MLRQSAPTRQAGPCGSSNSANASDLSSATRAPRRHDNALELGRQDGRLEHVLDRDLSRICAGPGSVTPCDGETGRWNRDSACRQSSFPNEEARAQSRGEYAPFGTRMLGGAARVDEGAGRRAARSCGTTATAPSFHARPLLTVSHRTKATMPPTGHRPRRSARGELK